MEKHLWRQHRFIIIHESTILTPVIINAIKENVHGQTYNALVLFAWYNYAMTNQIALCILISPLLCHEVERRTEEKKLLNSSLVVYDEYFYCPRLRGSEGTLFLYVLPSPKKKTLTFTITFVPFEVGLSYFTRAFLVMRPFRPYPNFLHCDLDCDLWTTYLKVLTFAITW